MTTPVVSLRQDHSLLRAADLFLRLRVSTIPIVDQSYAIVGVVSEKNVLNAISMEENWDRPIREVMEQRVSLIRCLNPCPCHLGVLSARHGASSHCR